MVINIHIHDHINLESHYLCTIQVGLLLNTVNHRLCNPEEELKEWFKFLLFIASYEKPRYDLLKMIGDFSHQFPEQVKEFAKQQVCDYLLVVTCLGICSSIFICMASIMHATLFFF